MLPPNPFLQLVPSRVPQAVQRVREQVWLRLAEVESISATEASPTYVTWEKARAAALKPLGQRPLHYGKLWDQRWFKLPLPAVKAGTYLKWNDESEATLYVGGVPHYGFDVAHRFAPLPPGTREVWVETIVSQTAIWHPEATGLSPEGSRFSGAELFSRNDLAWDVLHDFLVLEDLMRDELRLAFPTRDGEFGAIGTKPTLGLLPPLLRQLLRFLDDAVNALDVSGLSGAKKALAKAFKELPGYGAGPSAVLTGHAHIDLVWMWPERVGEQKAVHTFATANRLMDRYPEMRFAYSQPASYEAVRRISPQLDKIVKSRIKQGWWEAEGATYVESDTLIACGEALLRSFILGQDGFRDLTGKASPILWLPDVFGYSGCLPQMMRETGVEYFFTTKLTWNAITPFPHSSFRWAGADGTEITAHICQNNGYNQVVSVRELRTGAAAHRQCDVHNEFLAPTGYGDGGGGVTEEMCERARRVADLAGVPASRWGTIGGFFDRLGKLRDELPVYRGELYFEYHRGTYTTHGDVKAAMRAAERALQVREAAACVVGGRALDPADWKRVVFAQFHDYIPGSSIHEVYIEGKPELAEIATRNLADSQTLLGKTKSKTRAIFNPLPHPRVAFCDGEAFEIRPLSGQPWSSLSPVAFDAVSASPNRLANGRVDARFDAFGRLARFSVDGENVPLTRPANEFVLYPDFPHMFEAWDIDRQALSLGQPDNRKAKVLVVATCAHTASVVFKRPLGRASHVAVHYILDATSSVLRIEYQLDWREEQTLLKTHFPTKFVGRHARFAAPYGSVRRPQLGGDTQAEAMWEMPASRWAVVADDNESEGLFIVTESKFGFSCRDGVLSPSLVRSAKITLEERGANRGSHPENLRRTLAPSVFSDLGKYHIALAIGRFDPQAPREEQPAALADILFTPPLEYFGNVAQAGFLGLEGGDSLQPAWAMPVDQRTWTLRLHETLGRSGSALIHLNEGFSATPVDLSGKPLSKPTNTIAFRPYQIVSVKIERTENT